MALATCRDSLVIFLFSAPLVFLQRPPNIPAFVVYFLISTVWVSQLRGRKIVSYCGKNDSVRKLQQSRLKWTRMRWLLKNKFAPQQFPGIKKNKRPLSTDGHIWMHIVYRPLSSQVWIMTSAPLTLDTSEHCANVWQRKSRFTCQVVSSKNKCVRCSHLQQAWQAK